MAKQSTRKTSVCTTLGILLIVGACIVFPFAEEDTLDLFSGIGIGLFLLGFFIICIPSILAKRKNGAGDNQRSAVHNELEPPRHIAPSAIEEEDNDRYDLPKEEYKKKQEEYHHADAHREEEKKDDHIVCPSCGFINSPGRPECILCHKPLVRKCPKCGKENPINNHLCQHCGELLEQEKGK